MSRNDHLEPSVQGIFHELNSPIRVPGHNEEPFLEAGQAGGRSGRAASPRHDGHLLLSFSSLDQFFLETTNGIKDLGHVCVFAGIQLPLGLLHVFLGFDEGLRDLRNVVFGILQGGSNGFLHGSHHVVIDDAIVLEPLLSHDLPLYVQIRILPGFLESNPDVFQARPPWVYMNGNSVRLLPVHTCEHSFHGGYFFAAVIHVIIGHLILPPRVCAMKCWWVTRMDRSFCLDGSITKIAKLIE